MPTVLMRLARLGLRVRVRVHGWRLSAAVAVLVFATRRAVHAVAHAQAADRGGRAPRHHRRLQRADVQRRQRQHLLRAAARALAGQAFGQCQTHFGQRFGATVLAVRQGGELLVSPPWDTPLREGALLYYVAARRIDQTRLSAQPRR